MEPTGFRETGSRDAMKRSVSYDASYLISRLGCGAPDGFTNVDLAFARRFVEAGAARFVRRRRGAPAMMRRGLARRLVAFHEADFSRPGPRGVQVAFSAVRDALVEGRPFVSPAATIAPVTFDPAAFLADRRADLLRAAIRLSPSDGPIPQGALYFAATPFRFENPAEFRWLDRRPDVSPVFLVHDLLPLDHPEFFVPGEDGRFDRRTATALARARGIVVTSRAVHERLLAEMAHRRVAAVPTLVAPLPSPFSGIERAGLDDADLARVPYFVMVATIEPRKNHLFLLAIWRRMAEIAAARGEAVPALVLAGRRGRENEQVIDVLERARFARDHVIEATGLCDRDLARLIANARALLLPSFAEGYGLPIVEALSLGTPVVAADIPVFREVALGAALHHDVVDGLGWMRTIRELTDPTSDTSRRARDLARSFVAPTWSGYFDTIETFAGDL